MSKRFIAFCIAFLLAGCGSTPHKITYPGSNSVTSKPVDIYVLLREPELGFTSSRSVSGASAAGAIVFSGIITGILVGMLTSSEVNKLEKVIKDNLVPIHNNLAELNFEKRLVDEIKENFTASDMEIGNIIAVSDWNEIKSATNVGDSFFILRARHKMNPGLFFPYVSLSSWFVTRAPEFTENTIHYKNDFVYVGHSLGAAEKTDDYIAEKVAAVNAEFYALSERRQKDIKYKRKHLEDLTKARTKTIRLAELHEINARKWATPMKEILSDELKSGIETLVALLNSDFNDATPTADYAKDATNTPGYFGNHKSNIIQDSAERFILRSANGENSGVLCSAPKRDADGATLHVCP